MEDWVNLAKMSSDQTPVVIINGALDKVSISLSMLWLWEECAFSVTHICKL